MVLKTEINGQFMFHEIIIEIMFNELLFVNKKFKVIGSVKLSPYILSYQQGGLVVCKASDACLPKKGGPTSFKI